MRKNADAIVIGAGVIGAATAFELCKRGYKTLNIDKLPAAGYGPTSSSCSIVRAHYSSWDGVAMAYEGFAYWHDWPNYLEIDTTSAGSRSTWSAARSSSRARPATTRRSSSTTGTSGVEFEDWDTETLAERVPYYDVHEFWPPRRPEDEEFWRQPDERAARRDLHAAAPAT